MLEVWIKQLPPKSKMTRISKSRQGNLPNEQNFPHFYHISVHILALYSHMRQRPLSMEEKALVGNDKPAIQWSNSYQLEDHQHINDFSGSSIYQ